MSDPPSYDQDLLARLNALKQSNICLEHQKPSTGILKEPPSHEDALSARLKSLRNGGTANAASSASLPPGSPKPFPASQLGPPSSSYQSPEIAANSEGGLPNILTLGKTAQNFGQPQSGIGTSAGFDEQADALMSQLEQETALDKSTRQDDGSHSVVDREAHGNGLASVETDLNEGVSLQQKADALMARMQQQNAARQSTQPNDKFGDDGDDSDGTDLEAEAREAEELLAQLMDEAQSELAEERETEKLQKTRSDREEMPPPAKKSSPKEGADDSGLDLPSAPTKLNDLPSSTDRSRQSIDFESDIAARMAALSGSSSGVDSLGLPSAPTKLPSKAALIPPKPKDPENWCCVCYDNATILCHDCGDEDTFYCAKCWKEGHLGEFAEEERTHEWSKYRRPR